jgi:hypothetical protein
VEVAVRISPRSVALILVALLGCSVQAQAPAAEGDAARVEELLSATKYSFKRLEGSKQPVWTIKRKAENLKEFEVILTVKNGLLTTFVTVALKDNIRRSIELCDRMVKFNYAWDSVKVGFDGDEDAYVRMDSRLRIVDTQEFTHVIEQVSTTAEALHKELQPYLIKPPSGGN